MYAMCQSMWKSFGDASEMHRRSTEFNAQGHTLTVMSSPLCEDSTLICHLLYHGSDGLESVISKPRTLIEVIESNSITPISSISPINILLVTQSAQSAQSRSLH